MYLLSQAKTFRKMLKRLRNSGRFNEELLEKVVDCLLEGRLLPPERRDHQLSGDLQEFRECHIAGDTLLLYMKNQMNQKITLVKIGTHHEIFGN